MIDQFPFERIHVHVVQFFNSLLQTPNIKIVEAPLPETAKLILAAREGQTKLSRRVAFFATQAARDALLQHSNYRGRRNLTLIFDDNVGVVRFGCGPNLRS